LSRDILRPHLGYRIVRMRRAKKKRFNSKIKMRRKEMLRGEGRRRPLRLNQSLSKTFNHAKSG